MNIRGFLASSFNEWENRVAAVIFVGGCHWRCAYCHGARLVENDARLPEIATDKIFATLRERKKWLDGVVITGGEPTLQRDLLPFLRQLHELNLPLKLSTNGARPEIIAKILTEKLLTCLSLDYKTTLDQRLSDLAQTSIDEVANVKKSFTLLRESNVAEKELHTTLCPTFISYEIIETMAANLNIDSALWVLQQYEPEVEMLNAKIAGLKRFNEDELTKCQNLAEQYHPRVLLHRGK